MKANEYQELALKSIDSKSVGDRGKLLVNCALGLSGESGEFADHLKKYLFQEQEMDDEHLIDELGDICWYVAVAAYSLNCSFDKVMKNNIKKLKKRYPNGFDSEKLINKVK